MYIINGQVHPHINDEHRTHGTNAAPMRHHQSGKNPEKSRVLALFLPYMPYMSYIIHYITIYYLFLLLLKSFISNNLKEVKNKYDTTDITTIKK